MAIGTPVDLGHQASSASAATLTITTLAAVTAGDALIGFYGASTASIPTSITDTAGNSYTFFNFGTTILTGVYYCPNALAMSSSASIIVTNNGSITRTAITFLKVSGMSTSALVISDRGIYQAGSLTVAATATSATKAYNAQAQTTELLIECMGSLGTNPGTFTPTTGFTAIGGTPGSTCVLLPAYKVTSVGTQTTINPSWVNSASHRTGMVAFRGAVATNTARPDGLLTGFGT